MATNFIAPDDPLTLPAPSGGVVSGTAYLIGATFGVAGNSAAEGAGFPLHRRGVWQLPKATGVNFGVGAKLYWDNTASAVTSTATSNILIGVSRQARVNADTTVEVALGLVA
jgi:predicted RecA/RadA family phage recombinase